MLVLDVFFFQAEDGIRELVRSRGLGDVYKRQALLGLACRCCVPGEGRRGGVPVVDVRQRRMTTEVLPPRSS